MTSLLFSLVIIFACIAVGHAIVRGIAMHNRPEWGGKVDEEMGFAFLVFGTILGFFLLVIVMAIAAFAFSL